MKYAQISKETVGHLYACYNSLENSPLDVQIRLIVEIRVSQINRCAFCCRLHAEQARNNGVAQEKLDRIPGWRRSRHFTDNERLALEWAEAVTAAQPDVDDLRERVMAAFSEREVVDLTVTIAAMNALNRMATTIGDQD